ncbi:MAG: 4-carboxymuconolactone decarboxylase [Alphaproteobacteria bacterium]|nr:4-carboxymuconolactone decarboxylase [Alphaproteobacteria bacterium]
MRFALKTIGIAALALLPAAAIAGPPYDTDDPEPTELHHWEIYAFGAGTAHQGLVEGDLGTDLNYGLLPGVQLTATLPLSFETGAGTRLVRGDAQIGLKYRFLHREKAGLSFAIFPRLILPTAQRGFGTGRLRVLLPAWGQKDIGDWSIFGGGGYTINPGSGNRNYWQSSLAITRSASKRLSLGAEISRQGSDSVGSGGITRLGVGGIYSLKGPFSILASAGPQFEDGSRRAGFHGYLALGINF